MSSTRWQQLYHVRAKCHDLARVVKLRGAREFWTDMIYSMVANGADIETQDIEKMAQYLSTNLDKDKPPLTTPIDVNSAKPEVLRLLSPISDSVNDIVAFRSKQKLSVVEDLLNVKGITKEDLQRIKPFVVVR